jgi:hypothetical protein
VRVDWERLYKLSGEAADLLVDGHYQGVRGGIVSLSDELISPFY